MKKKNIISNVTMLDHFTQSEKDIVKGGSGKVKIKGTASVNYKGVSGGIEVSNNNVIGD
ncbi:MAG: hypothetical protein UD961_08055 [Bacteroidales bacterium]|nr:hypothetical protein [Bacteroidales bacterium]